MFADLWQLKSALIWNPADNVIGTPQHLSGAKPLAERGAVHVVLLLSESADVAATGRWMVWRWSHGHGAVLISGRWDTLWWTNILPWNITIFNGKIHENPLFQWPFSIAMLNYQRVTTWLMGQSSLSPWLLWYFWGLWSFNTFIAIINGYLVGGYTVVYHIFRHNHMFGSLVDPWFEIDPYVWPVQQALFSQLNRDNGATNSEIWWLMMVNGDY